VDRFVVVRIVGVGPLDDVGRFKEWFLLQPTDTALVFVVGQPNSAEELLADSSLLVGSLLGSEGFPFFGQ